MTATGKPSSSDKCIDLVTQLSGQAATGWAMVGILDLTNELLLDAASNTITRHA